MGFASTIVSIDELSLSANNKAEFYLVRSGTAAIVGRNIRMLKTIGLKGAISDFSTSGLLSLDDIPQLRLTLAEALETELSEASKRKLKNFLGIE